jgi:acetyl-CoA carboxylase biotin carboxyl carrier protein
MTIDEIKEFIRVVQETGIAELEYQKGDERVRVKMPSGVAHESVHLASGNPAATGVLPAQPALATSGVDSKVQPAVSSPDDEKNEIVKSPIVGTYYDCPTPGSAPFVKVGERVEAKQVLCIIESMKLMNEIESDFAGIVVAKHIENGRPVEYGESLFTIRPI